MKDDRLKSRLLKIERIESGRVKTNRIKSITDQHMDADHSQFKKNRLCKITLSDVN
jgi:hypothetical protein